MLKRRAYERAGVAAYWIVDPRVPSVTVLELQDGAYVEVARAAGRQPLVVTVPYALEVVPDDLLR